MRRLPVPFALAAALLGGCSDDGSPSPAAGPASGEALFSRRVGGLSCADCHALSGEDQPRETRRLVGHTLRDATRRPSWWYGTLRADAGATVEDAVRTCMARFQQRTWNLILPVKGDGSRDLSKVEVPPAEVAALVAFLEANAAPGPHPPMPAMKDDSPVALRRIDALAGDGTRGSAVYDRACALCHGPDGRGDLAPPLRGPDSMTTRSRTIEVVRRGPDGAARKGMDAWMPWFTPDVLPDQDLADVAAWLDGP